MKEIKCLNNTETKKKRRGHKECNAKLSIGVVPQELILDPFFTPRETLKYQSGYYGVPKKENCIEEILETVGLLDKADAYPRSLSGGMRRRLMIGKAMVHRPPILILDEPTTGLDPIMSEQINKLIRKLVEKKKITTITITHDMDSVYHFADKVAFINNGSIFWYGDVKKIKSVKKIELKKFINGTI